MEKTIRQYARQKAIFCVYQNLLINASLEELLHFIDLDPELKDGYSAKKFAIRLVKTVLENKDNYIVLISKELKKGWTFNRLSYMEQAILLVATCELADSELDKRIIINEAVINAKEFCDEESYKFINGVLNEVI
ncbi:transcription antitermination factor NusB [Sharpea azabuensis]|uniref:Transcription antitermination factor NusB n=1 Tax=Sharpea porci TaxID=2652286 RepID=A0A844FS73_9FIRM|nr:transcription antitermination factor NusB [Sharpea porci]MDD6711955.1 transcription antitermination factor NusB [Sharpea porci]MST88436.1 transcription antitermination factor NusB [Sharpea porci]